MRKFETLSKNQSLVWQGASDKLGKLQLADNSIGQNLITEVYSNPLIQPERYRNREGVLHCRMTLPGTHMNSSSVHVSFAWFTIVTSSRGSASPLPSGSK